MQDVTEPSTNNNSQILVDQERSELTPLYSNIPDIGSLRLIRAFFFGFSVTVTVALGVQMYYGKSQISPHGSIASDNKICTEIGAAVLRQGGNAVDAAIAVAFCMGVVNPHITGLGSGGFMLIYDQRERKVLNSIDFRVTRSNDSGIGIPGFVAGLHLAHKLHGVLPWKTLIMPALTVAETGFRVSQTLINSVSYLHPNTSHNNDLKDWFDSLILDEVITNHKLAETLSIIANTGSIDFYNKILPDELLDLVDVQDIIDYQAILSSSIKSTFLQYDIVAPSQGSGGPLLLNNLKYLNSSLPPLVSVIEAYSHVAENWPTSSGSHVASLDINDIFVSIVSGLGTILGSQILTKSGFILNNILEITNDKYSQRPDVLVTPVVVVQNGQICGRRFVLGGGDVRDTVQALVYLLRNPSANLTDSIEAPRVRIFSSRLAIEEKNFISKDDYMQLSNYNFTKASPVYPSINVIQKIKDSVISHADSRGFGYSSTF